MTSSPQKLFYSSVVIFIISVFVCIIAMVKYWELKNSLMPYPNELPMDPGRLRMKMLDTKRFQIVGNSSDDDWERLFPRGYGFAYLGDDYRMFGVSMFHQFHCLHTIRQAIIDRDVYGHAQHCLTYLRNTILCSSDLTIEPQFEFGKVDGLGVSHECRNWTAVYEWMDRNYEEYLEHNATLLAKFNGKK